MFRSFVEGMSNEDTQAASRFIEEVSEEIVSEKDLTEDDRSMIIKQLEMEVY